MKHRGRCDCGKLVMALGYAAHKRGKAHQKWWADYVAFMDMIGRIVQPQHGQRQAAREES